METLEARQALPKCCCRATWDSFSYCPHFPMLGKNGAVEGLCAKGNFEVDITWENGSLKEATILSKAGAPCHVRYGDKTLTFKTSKGKTYKIAMENGELKTLR